MPGNDSEEDEIRALTDEYLRLAHAMQSGIKALMSIDSKLVEPKHLRVGIDSAHVSHEGLATLLMSKGIITRLEYHRAMRDAMLAEVRRNEATLSKAFNREVRLA